MCNLVLNKWGYLQRHSRRHSNPFDLYKEFCMKQFLFWNVCKTCHIQSHIGEGWKTHHMSFLYLCLGGRLYKIYFICLSFHPSAHLLTAFSESMDYIPALFCMWPEIYNLQNLLELNIFSKFVFAYSWAKWKQNYNHELLLWYGWPTKMRLALFSAGTIFRDCHHCKSTTRCNQYLNLCRS